MEKIKAAVTIESMASRSSKSSSSAMTGVSTGISSALSSSTSTGAAETRVRTIKPSEYKAAAACLAEAFATDDVAAYFFECPDTQGWSAARKWALHVKLMEFITYIHACYGLVQVVVGGDGEARATPTAANTVATAGAAGAARSFDAVALWQPPHTHYPESWLAALRTGLWRLLLQVRVRLSREGRERLFREFFPLLHLTKEEVLQERDPEAWYLVYLGTHSRARGRGMAKKLIGEITRKADAEHRACYLESSNKANLPLYRKLGFETCRTIELERDSKKVGMDIMVREPVALKPVIIQLPTVELPTQPPAPATTTSAVVENQTS